MIGIETAVGERVLGYFRRHPMSLFKSSLLPLIAIMVGAILLNFSLHLVSFLGIVLIVLAAGRILYEFVIWYYDIYVVTNRRIIDIDQRGLFSRQIVEATLDKVQNISIETHGLFQTIFNYGQITIQTAGNPLVFKNLADPNKVQHLIAQAVEGAHHA